MEDKLQQLKTRLVEISDLEAVGSVLTWDQSTYMPPGAATARGNQIATIAKLAHEKLTDPALGRLLDELQPYAESLPPDSDDACLLSVARRDFERAVQVPTEFMARLSAHIAHSYTVWSQARPANDFAAVQPCLETMLELSRQYSSFFRGYAHIADPLIAASDYGIQTSIIQALFAELRQQQVPIVQAITAQEPANDAVLRSHFPTEQQLAFALDVIERFGFDSQRGRQDFSPHPFMIRLGAGDVRITTRIDEYDLSNALFSTLHEAGHAMYEQGIRPELEMTPLANGTSSGVHESQSRLWENLIGRSRPFWEFFYPHLQQVFPAQLHAVPLDTFYRAINKVQPSLIRTEADEVTYNLHVMLRFDFELDLLEGRLAVRDLPEAWRERYKADLGIAPPDDRDGVLQDVHWFSGMIGGAFQGYALGNILSAQFFDAAVRAHPEIRSEIARGEFGTLYSWLKEHIYQHGRKFTATELVQRATGEPMRIEPYVAYLRQKYGELYTL